MSQITASRSEQEHWTASLQYNELGQEIERILPGDVISKWQYDVTGRPTHHRISSQNRDTRRRAYNWDVNHRLRSMVNELIGVKVTYGYDEFSNLVWSNEGGQFDFLHRSVDDVGNLYETKEKTDRVYGAGSRLLETKEATFSYDEEGNLAQKVEKNGDTWKYEYNGNGMMSKVIKPDRTEVTFKYDSLGRRIEKSSNEKTMHFIWDGNTILNEYYLQDNSDIFENLDEYYSQNKSQIPDNLVTWVFNEGFIPSAKITSEGNYSIFSDYLGTPVEAYDEQGKKVWSAELDIYGRVMEFTGEEHFIPYRCQGQYHDVETGLYYNRFRYYSPKEGTYTQPDPIGLEGNNPTLYGYVKDPLHEVDPFGLNPFPSKRAALRYAKELAGIPRSQQPVRQWTVGSDYNKHGYENYKVSNDQGSQGRYYEFVNDRGEKKVTVLHTNDPERAPHAHAGTHKGPPNDPKRFTYDFKEERYRKINDPKTKDHHLDIKCKKG
ncbi:RHS repeat-associated core domain-containing protein [Lysinibacillus xylanilyticus]|uniref:RHS repeat-associated core domain-containing protein n=1 Tax=Lysinibacillus xylanilyticus TaxID=582475 RepID=UPI0013793A68|nr:RHS repeat-associated core domain-containing protein [Lysinibacillus xylanilyticus]